ncbi:hypothetical protein [Gynuella sunshinyii]|uniref:Uncharacterized protein n=1 Tax=Gynuella sunshinyii YC6258 TaxID=1445510 RepID=A0A0C5VKG2_9GAMM|nr:hypothetical protein [Gynuella sunshinyii]AJQ94741.1 hypothetical Protein YC6258_02703 [Gynuella sunshinyii YC6258]
MSTKNHHITHGIPFAFDGDNRFICIGKPGNIFRLMTDGCGTRRFDQGKNVRKLTRFICHTLDDVIGSLVNEDEAYG